MGGVSLQPCLFRTAYKRSRGTTLVSRDVTWIDLFPRRWQDADWRESVAVGPRLDQICTAGCGVLSTTVTNIKQSGVPIRYEGAAWRRESGGVGWLKASLLHLSRVHCPSDLWVCLHPLLRVFMCVCRYAGRCRCLWQPGAAVGGWMGVNELTLSSSYTSRKKQTN